MAAGLFYLLSQAAFFWFFFSYGLPLIGKLSTLGTVLQEEVWNAEKGIFEYTRGDNSMLVLLYGISTLLLCLLFYALYLSSVKASLARKSMAEA